MDVDQVQRCADRLKALADPNRLRIVKALQKGPMNVSEVAQVLEMEIANASHHLRCLRDVGILQTRRNGKFIYYSVAESVLLEVSQDQSLNLGCCQLDLSGLHVQDTQQEPVQIECPAELANGETPVVEH